GDKIDEVLLLKMNGPNTYTAEDVLELQCHGGPGVIEKILRLLVRQGARLAAPGEFTRRAFENGRIDLAQAEAVADLINARAGQSGKAALFQLEGRLSKSITGIRKELLNLLAHIEVTFDYPEHDMEAATNSLVSQALEGISKKIHHLADSFNKGRILREGINTVITGRPNVGKSTLLNSLSGYNRAIVTEIPGTTRDIIEEYIDIRGLPLRLIDTAGIRETKDTIEKIGVSLARKEMKRADLILFILDASEGIYKQDNDLFEEISKLDSRCIVILNKADLANKADLYSLWEKIKGKGYPVVITALCNTSGGCAFDSINCQDSDSGLLNSGQSELEEMIYEMFSSGMFDINNEALITNVRHKDLVDKTLVACHSALHESDAGKTLDCVAIDIGTALAYLGEITGETVTADLLEEIFSRFCIGK
ncbi:MAG: tRNA uridine-5-carboxymethylaminomethyl(34) synthesis GTPase MnmE, partial [Clostridiales bacterium]|nr:tRNA uridine-5-carboxymethylaminomethyl(34) synthesis GTPase MnmE [Clostridiales bacterium]